MSFTKNLSEMLADIEKSDKKIAVINRRYCINEFGQQYHRFFQNHFKSSPIRSYVFVGSSLSGQDLADALVEEGNENGLSELSLSFYAVSFFKEIHNAMKEKPQGRVLIFKAHLLDANTARLVDQLARSARKHSLDWNFILIGDLRTFKRDLPRRFSKALHLPSSKISNSRSVGRAIRLTTKSWVFIVTCLLSLLVLIYALFSTYAGREDSVGVGKYNLRNSRDTTSLGRVDSVKLIERISATSSSRVSVHKTRYLEKDKFGTSMIAINNEIEQVFNVNNIDVLLDLFSIDEIMQMLLIDKGAGFKVKDSQGLGMRKTREQRSRNLA